MDLQQAVRRAKIQSLFLMALTLIFFGLALFYGDRLVRTNAELAATRARLEATIEQHALELSRRELRRADLDPSDRDFLDAEVTRLTPNPATAQDHYILGVSAFLNEDYETAHDEYTLALELRDDWVDVYLARGTNFAAQREYGQAVQDLSAGLRLADDRADLYAARCFVFLRSGRLDDALQDCNTAVADTFEGDWVPLNYRGFVHYMLGDDDQAIDDWTRAAEYRVDPLSKARSLENLGLVYLRTEDWIRALDHATDVHDLSADRPWNCLFRGIAADKLNEEEVAESALQCWRESDVSVDDLLALRGYLAPSLHSYVDGP